MKDWSELKFWSTTYPELPAKMPKFRKGSGEGAGMDFSKVFPPPEHWFRAFDLCPYDKVKCVILGQDPYHKEGLANGLAFSVWPHVKSWPPSLRNVLAEYQSDLGLPCPRTGDLRPWADAGVLLLNTILTGGYAEGEKGKALSHQGIGWERLTYEVLSVLSKERDGIVFMLWGKKAQEYMALVDTSRHCVLTANHPSPLSKTGFLGCKHFSKANAYRKEKELEEINWELPHK